MVWVKLIPETYWDSVLHHPLLLELLLPDIGSPRGGLEKALHFGHERNSLGI